MDHYTYKFNYDTHQGQVDAVSFFGHHIRFIKTPLHEIQLLAVKQNGRSIFYISNPSESIQLAAIENNPYAIYDIESPTQNVKEIAMKHDISIREFFSDKEQKKKYNNTIQPHVKIKEHLSVLDEIIEDTDSINENE
jgi:hypothetical protein